LDRLAASDRTFDGGGMSNDVAILNWHFCMCGNIIVIEEGETEEGRDACEECKAGAVKKSIEGAGE